MTEPESEAAEEAVGYDFDKAFQRKIVTLFVRDTTFAMRTKDLVKPEYFTEAAFGALVRIVQDHLKTYKAAPGIKVLPMLIKEEIAKKRIRPDMKDEIVAAVRDVATTKDLTGADFIGDKVQEFAQHQEIGQAFLDSMAALEKGDFEAIKKRMKAAFAVGTSSAGERYDYWAEIEHRTKRRMDEKAGLIVKNGITTGYAMLDNYLYHRGWGRRELSCLMGAAKAGKSLGLGDFTKNASLAGYNTAYFSLEVASWIIAERLDAAVSDVVIHGLHKDPEEVDRIVRSMGAKAGRLIMRDFASGTLKPSVLHRELEDLRADGIIIDLCAVDYADIMAAEYRADNLIENLRSIYIDLRAIAHEMDCAMLTATQTNRDGAKASTAKATDVGDDWNKARTVDILIGINATDEEKRSGLARLYWALSRNTRDGFTLEIKQNREKMQFIKEIIGEIGA